MHEGHRSRMYEKLRSHPDSLEEHEMLEILLFNAIPRVNTNPIAHELLDAFGSIERMFDADMDSLLRVRGVGLQTAAYLQGISYFFKAYKGSKHDTMPRKYTSETFPDFLRERFGTMTYEAVDVYCLDEQGNIINRKIFTDGNKESVKISPKELTQAVVQRQNRAIVLAHNHVTGNCHPSKEDDQMTIQCQMLCSMNNIRLLDHFIYAGGEIYSYYQSGKMSRIAQNYHVQTVLRRGDNE